MMPQLLDEGFIKVCGVTNTSDAELIVDAGASAIGLILSESKRRISPDLASDIARHVRGRGIVVAVVRNESDEYVIQCVEKIQPDFVQYHGQPSENLTNELATRSVGIVWAGNESAFEQLQPPYPYSALLIDGETPGSGIEREWRPLSASSELPLLIAAGGLTPLNVANAIFSGNYGGVDVATGVEVTPGVKDPTLVREFISNARTAFHDSRRN